MDLYFKHRNYCPNALAVWWANEWLTGRMSEWTWSDGQSASRERSSSRVELHSLQWLIGLYMFAACELLALKFLSALLSSGLSVALLNVQCTELNFLLGRVYQRFCANGTGTGTVPGTGAGAFENRCVRTWNRVSVCNASSLQITCNPLMCFLLVFRLLLTMVIVASNHDTRKGEGKRRRQVVAGGGNKVLLLKLER